MKANVKARLDKATGALMKNLGWKILSILIALLIWSYVIASDPSITRDISVTGVDVIVSGQSVLQGRGLALLTDAAEALSDVRVRVKVPQSDYVRVSPDSVSVELDLTRIRQTGTQLVTLTGTSSYGDVVQIIPETIELDVEELDQRTVPVNVFLDAPEDSGYWYSVNQKNPAQISVSGPSSVVAQVASALVTMDLTDISASTSRAEQLTLLNAAGEEITFPLTRSTTSVTVGVDAYPTRQLYVETDPDTTTTGALPEGYRISDVAVSPDIITVAGDQALLDALTDLSIVPVDVTGAKQSFSVVAALSSIKDLKYLSSAQVTVTVYIEELLTIQRFGDIPVEARGAAADQKVTLDAHYVEVKVEGAYSAVKELNDEDLIAVVDVSGLEKGTYTLPVTVQVDNNPNLSLACYPETVQVVIE